MPKKLILTKYEGTVGELAGIFPAGTLVVVDDEIKAAIRLTSLPREDALAIVQQLDGETMTRLGEILDSQYPGLRAEIQPPPPPPPPAPSAPEEESAAPVIAEDAEPAEPEAPVSAESVSPPAPALPSFGAPSGEAQAGVSADEQEHAVETAPAEDHPALGG